MRHDEGWEDFVNHVNTGIDGLSVQDNYTVDHGDIIEAIMVDDPRYDPRSCDQPFPLEQARDAGRARLPIRQSIVTILDGNHPRKLYRYGDLTQYMCSALNNTGAKITYGTWSCKIHWLDNRGDLMFKTFHTHGRKGITSTADDPKRREVNKQLILKRHLKFKASDCAIMSKGHTHQLIISKPEPELFLYDKDNVIKQGYTHWAHTKQYIHPDFRWYVNTGSFLKLYGEDGETSYAEIGEYDPVELGYALVKVREKKIDSVTKIIL
jgi:hypothetical protein